MTDGRGPVALVTGGSAGIGRAVVESLASQGSPVVNLDREKPQPEIAGASTVLGDVSLAESVHRAVARAGEYGGLDIVVCNAGIACVGQLDDISPEAFDHAFAVNVRGTYLAIREALPWLRKSVAPSIVVVSSNAGLIGRASDPVYSATKFALNGLVRSLSIGLARDRIRVNAVCPGPVDTPGMWHGGAPDASALPEILRNVPLGRAMGRMAGADEIAEAVVFLCSERASFITGAILPVDGGKTAGLDE
jgi:NAD(P)-dependent dehydrogenase (short-subunit alcohol dehydrogenase family)